MQQELLNLKNQALALVGEANDEPELESLRLAYLGRRGKLNLLLKNLPKLSAEERKRLGQLANEVKNALTQAIAAKSQSFGSLADLKTEAVDMTLPGKAKALGHLHPMTQAISEISQIFAKLGFVRVRYPQVDWDWYMFEALNMPEGHPARDEWETFFVQAPANPKLGQMVMSVHTSNGQIREMQRLGGKPPIRMLNIAKCYRRQQDMTHTHMFHQFEGMLVDRDINITHLKGVLDYFTEAWFGRGVRSRLRPFHFRFTEPSFEVDFSCSNCGGRGCRSCKSGWLEIGGAGMIHPKVLTAGGIDPAKYSGFAFGMGPERLVMLRSQIPNIRLLYENDPKFLEQF